MRAVSDVPDAMIQLMLHWVFRWCTKLGCLVSHPHNPVRFVIQKCPTSRGSHPCRCGFEDPKKTTRELVNATPNSIETEVSLLAKKGKSNQRLHGRYSPFVILFVVLKLFPRTQASWLQTDNIKVNIKVWLSLSCWSNLKHILSLSIPYDLQPQITCSNPRQLWTLGCPAKRTCQERFEAWRRTLDASISHQVMTGVCFVTVSGVCFVSGYVSPKSNFKPYLKLITQKQSTSLEFLLT